MNNSDNKSVYDTQVTVMACRPRVFIPFKNIPLIARRHNSCGRISNLDEHILSTYDGSLACHNIVIPDLGFSSLNQRHVAFTHNSERW